MKKRIIKLLIITMIMIAVTGCKRSDDTFRIKNLTVPETTESTSSSLEFHTEEETGTKAEEFYQAFMNGDMEVLTSEEYGEDDQEYNFDGLLYGYYNIEQLTAVAKETLLDGDIMTSYAYLDCGEDGIDELLIRFINPDKNLFWTVVISYYEDELHLNYNYSHGGRVYANLYETGYLERGGANSAFEYVIDLIKLDVHGYGKTVFSDTVFNGLSVYSIVYDLDGNGHDNVMDSDDFPGVSDMFQVREYKTDDTVKVSVSNWSESADIRANEEMFMDYLESLGAEVIEETRMEELCSIVPYQGAEVEWKIWNKEIKSEDDDFLSLSTCYDYQYEYEEYKVSYQKLYINSNKQSDESKLMREDVPALSAALDEYNNAEEQAAYEYIQDYEKYLAGSGTYECEYQSKPYVQRADKHVLSILNEVYEYSGSRPMNWTSGHNYDTETGKKLTIDDIVKDRKQFSNTLSDILMNKGDKYEGAFYENYEEIIDSMIAEDTLTWIIGYDRMTVYFNQEDIANFVVGSIIVDLKFTEHPELFESKYMDVPENYAIQLPLAEYLSYDLDGDGEDEEISCYIGNDGELNSTEVSVGDETASIEGYFFGGDSTLIHLSDGRNYVYMEVLEEGDYEELLIFDVSNSPKYVDKAEGTEMSYGMGMMSYVADTGEYRKMLLTDPYSFILETTGDLLGTHSMFKTYHVADGDSPISDDETYTYSIPFQITSKIELTMTDTDGGERTIPAGTVFDVLYTDGEYYAEIRTGSKIYILPIEIKIEVESGYQVKLVEGWYLEDAFDGIMYAG